MDLKWDDVSDVLNRGFVAGAIGAPVDLANLALTPFGLGSERPFMGSEWLGARMQKAGIVSNKRRPLAEFAAGLISPAGAVTGAAKGATGAVALAGMFAGKGAKTADLVKPVADEMSKLHRYPVASTSGLPTHLGLLRELADPRYRDYLSRASKESGKNEAIKAFGDSRLIPEIKEMISDKSLLTQSESKLYFGTSSAPEKGEMFYGAARPLTRDKTRAESYGNLVEVTIPKGSRLIPLNVMGAEELTLLPGSRIEFNEHGKATLADDGTSYTSDLMNFVEGLSQQ